MCPAFCNPSSYDIYADWCRDHGRIPPSREWWEDHRSPAPGVIIDLPGHRECNRPQRQSDVEFDREVERREGWSFE